MLKCIKLLLWSSILGDWEIRRWHFKKHFSMSLLVGCPELKRNLPLLPWYVTSYKSCWSWFLFTNVYLHIAALLKRVCIWNYDDSWTTKVESRSPSKTRHFHGVFHKDTEKGRGLWSSVQASKSSGSYHGIIIPIEIKFPQ